MKEKKTHSFIFKVVGCTTSFLLIFFREDKLNPNIMNSEDSFREGAKVGDSHLFKLIQAVDEDDNAELDFDEFCKLFRGAF